MRRAILWGAVLAILVSSPPAWAQPKKAGFSDDAIDAAVKKGVDFLFSKQQPDGSWPPYGSMVQGSNYPLGPTALATYAILESGVKPQDDPRIAKAIQWLVDKMAACIQQTENPPAKGADRTSGLNWVRTYEAGLVCNVYNAANRTTNNKYKPELDKLAEVMWKYHNNGAYNYFMIRLGEEPDKTGVGDPGASKGNRFKRPPEFDNSNSQYGLLAVWAALMSKGEIPREYWGEVYRHWANCQCADGGWNYQGAGLESRGTMTAAGVASMFVCFDALFADVLVATGNANNEFKPIQKGLDWFDKNFERSLSSPDWGGAYYLYGVERVGLASGYKYFGSADWFKLGAQKLLSSQEPGGNWGAVYNTGLSLLFLIRGQHAVLVNKLIYEGDWRNRSRDLAQLTRNLSTDFEKQVNWQIVNLKVPVSEWHDAPILYLAGSQEPKFQPEDVDKLKLFVQQGGTLMMVTEGGGAGFTKGVKDLCAKMFPQYPLAEAPKGHDLYTAHAKLTPGRPRFNIVSNGIRALVIHTDTDLPRSWQQYNIATEKFAFDAGMNLYVYVTDQGTGLRPRGTTLWPDPTEEAPATAIKVFRVAHGGNADPEPLAFERLKLLMGNQCKVKLEFETVKADKLDAATAKVALLTGTGKLAMTGDEKNGLKKFVTAGGTVLIDAAGGSKAFAESAKEMLAELYGPEAMRILASSSPIYTLPGYAIGKVKYRRRTQSRLTDPNLRAILEGDRPGIVFSAEDLTAGLLGVSCFSIEGYDAGDEGGTKPGTAYQIVRNVILAAAGVRTAASAPAGATADKPAESSAPTIK